MPLGTTLPFGLRDVKITPYTDLTATVLGASIDLPNSRTLSFAEVEDFTELRGDDSVVATHGNGPGVEWELEGGGVSFEIVAAMYGGTISSTGTTPNQVKKIEKDITDQRPYFKIEGQSISDNGGDMHAVIHRCKATDNLTGTMGDGEWFLMGASGIGMKSLAAATLNKVWAWVQNETITAIV